MRSISSSDNRPLSAVMVIFSALPVPLSAADTMGWCWRVFEEGERVVVSAK